MNKGGDPSTLTTIYRVEMFFNLTGQSTLKVGLLNKKNSQSLCPNTVSVDICVHGYVL